MHNRIYNDKLNSTSGTLTNGNLKWYHTTENTYFSEIRLSGSEPYRLSLVYRDTDLVDNAHYLMTADGSFIPEKADVDHASTGTSYGIGTTGYYGHVKLYNSLAQSSYTDGYALSAYQGYRLNQNINNIITEINGDDTYTACNLYLTTNYGHLSFIIAIEPEIWVVFVDQSAQYSNVGVNVLTGDYTYKYQLCTTLGNYKDQTFLSYINTIIESYSYDDDTITATFNLRLKIKLNSTNSFKLFNIRGMVNPTSYSWVSG